MTSPQKIRKNLSTTVCHGYRFTNGVPSDFDYTLVGKYTVDGANRKLRSMFDDQSVVVTDVVNERKTYRMNAADFLANAIVEDDKQNNGQGE
jgi:hypothetical protein